MDGERPRVANGAKVTLATQHSAHALSRPILDLATQRPEQFGVAQEFVAVVDLGDMKPAVLRIDAGDALDSAAHIVESGLGQRPKVLGALKADPGNQRL